MTANMRDAITKISDSFKFMSKDFDLLQPVAHTEHSDCKLCLNKIR